MSGGAVTKNKREQNLNRRIFGSILTVAVVVLLATLVLVTGFLYDYFTGVLERQMRDEWEIAAAAITENGTAYLDRLTSTRYRLTVVAADGSVLCDTQSNAEAMENHADREEIRNALAGAEGKTVRYSNMAAGPASYGMTDTMGRMHSDAQFAGSSSVPAHVEMMGFLGMGNNPMVGATVAVAVAVAESLK